MSAYFTSSINTSVSWYCNRNSETYQRKNVAHGFDSVVAMLNYLHGRQIKHRDVPYLRRFPRGRTAEKLATYKLHLVDCTSTADVVGTLRQQTQAIDWKRIFNYVYIGGCCRRLM